MSPTTKKRRKICREVDHKLAACRHNKKRNWHMVFFDTPKCLTSSCLRPIWDIPVITIMWVFAGWPLVEAAKSNPYWGQTNHGDVASMSCCWVHTLVRGRAQGPQSWKYSDQRRPGSSRWFWICDKTTFYWLSKCAQIQSLGIPWDDLQEFNFDVQSTWTHWLVPKWLCWSGVWCVGSWLLDVSTCFVQASLRWGAKFKHP